MRTTLITLGISLLALAVGCGKKESPPATADKEPAQADKEAAVTPAPAPTAEATPTPVAEVTPGASAEKEALIASACAALGAIAEKEGGGPAGEWKAIGGVDGCKNIHSAIPDLEVVKKWSTCVQAQQAAGSGMAGVNAKCAIQ